MTPPRPVTIDANVFVSASVQSEVHHPASTASLRRFTDEGLVAFCPTLVIAETVAGIARPTGDVNLSRQGRSHIEDLPGMRLLSLDLDIARAAADIAAAHRLRGADAVYLAVARIHGATVITWDNEMLARGPAVVPTMTPTEWLRSTAGQ